MEVWIALILLLLTDFSIVMLARKMRNATRKTGYIVATVALALVALALTCYLIFSALLVNGVA